MTTANDFDALLRLESAARGLDFAEIRRDLMLKWTIENLDDSINQAKKEDAPFTAILERAFRCQQANDEAGYRLACEDWLMARHGVKRGDTVTLGGWARPRTVRIDAFEIRLEEDNLSRGSFITFTGPCLSHTIRTAFPDLHGQSITNSVRKVSLGK
jgi:hypothetical protein